MGRLAVRRDVDVTGFPRPTAPAPARQEISLPRRDAARRSTKTKKRGTKQSPHSHALIAPPAVKIYI
jgi:hypothetical protein